MLRAALRVPLRLYALAVSALTVVGGAALRNKIAALAITGVLGGAAVATYGAFAVPNGPQASVNLYWFWNSDPTIAPGAQAPLYQFLIRIDSPALYWKSGTAATAWTIIGHGASPGTGTVTSVTCLAGLSCAPNPIVGAGSIGPNLPGAACDPGSFVSALSSGGLGTCTAATGTIGGGGTTGDLSVFASPTTIGNYAGSTCGAGSGATALSAAGVLACAAFQAGGSVVGTQNRTAKFGAGGTSVGNGWAGDDGTTWGSAALYTIDEATGATASASTASTAAGSGVYGATFALQTNGTGTETISEYSSDTNRSVLRFRKARGTIAAPTAIASGDRAGSLGWDGWDGAAFVATAVITALAEGTIASGVVPGRVIVEPASPNGPVIERQRWNSLGEINMGTQVSQNCTLNVGQYAGTNVGEVPGTIVVTATSNAVAGTNTIFQNTFTVGDQITATTSSGVETHAIATIPSNTSMTIVGTWAGNATAVAYQDPSARPSVLCVQGNGTVLVDGVALPSGGSIGGGGVTGDLMAWTGPTTAGNYGGASACGAGSFITAIAATGATTCTAASGLISGLTANTIPKATSATAIGNSSATDDGTTFAISSGFSVAEAIGAASANELDLPGTLNAPALGAGPTNNWDPAGTGNLNGIERINENPSTNASVSGLVIGRAGQVVSIHNTSTTFTFTLTNADGGSTVANQYTLPNAGAYPIPPGGSFTIRASSTANGWRPWSSGIQGGGTATDLAIYSGPNAIGNYAGSSCGAGNAATALSAAGTLSCTSVTPGGSISGTTNTYAMFTSSTTVGNSTFPISESSATALTIGDSTANDVVTVSGMISGTSTNSTANPFGYAMIATGGTTGSRAAIRGDMTGTFDTTAGSLTVYGLWGDASGTKSAGGNNLVMIGTRGFSSGTADDTRGVLAQSSGTGGVAYGVFASTSGAATTARAVFGQATGAATTNVGGDFTATGATTNIALRSVAGDVLLNTTSGVTKFTTTAIGATASSAEIVGNAAASATVPTLIPNQTDATTGIGAQASGNVSVIAAATETMRFASGSITSLVGIHPTSASGYQLTTSAASATVPTLAPNRADVTTGIGAQASGNVSIIASATEVVRVSSGSIQILANIIATSSSGAEVANNTPSSTVPGLIPNRADTTTGIGAQASGNISLIGAGVESIRITSAGAVLEAGSMVGANAAGFRMPIGAASATVPTFNPNRADTTTGIGAQASGNISLIASATEIMRITGTGWLSQLSQNKGKITLTAGTGTATVLSGAICTCSDTAALPTLAGCSVTATTLTATGTGADVIAYTCQ